MSSKRIELGLVWCIPIGMVIMVIGWWPLAHLFPMAAPNASAHDIQQIFIRHNAGVKWGINCLAFGGVLWTGMYAGVASSLMRRVEPRGSALTTTQMIVGALSCVLFIVSLIPLMVAAFRPHENAHTIRMLNDMFTLPYIIAWWSYTVEWSLIGILAFRKVANNPFPRWFGWASFVSSAGIILLTLPLFYKSGPLDWRGGIAFYIPAFFVFGYYALSAFVFHRAVAATPESAYELTPEQRLELPAAPVPLATAGV